MCQRLLTKFEIKCQSKVAKIYVECESQDELWILWFKQLTIVKKPPIVNMAAMDAELF